MTRYRPRHGVAAGRAGWLSVEAIGMALAVAVAVALSLNPATVVAAAPAAGLPVAPVGLAAEPQARPVTPAPAGVAALAASAPVRLQVPAIDVDSAVQDLGLDDDGAMEVPDGGFPAGWYTGSPTPGSTGPAVLAGHVDFAGEPGVFAQLHRLQAGDEILVDRADGTTAVFGVSRVQQVPKDAFPTEDVYGDLAYAGLRLVTCGGTFDRAARSYRDNVVVYAELIDARTA